MTAGTAMTRPAAVVTSASATPAATIAGAAEPATLIAWNARMIPHTVPSRPISGATAAIVPSRPVLRSSSSFCWLSITCMISSASAGARRNPCSVWVATGPSGCGRSWKWLTASSKRPPSMAFMALRMAPSGLALRLR